MTKTKTKMKADYTSLNLERNYWIRAILLCLLVGLAYFGNIYRTNNNSDAINGVIINGPSVIAATTTSLVRGGVSNGNGNGDGDGGQEDFSSSSVGDNYIKSNTNTFVEEEEGGLLGDISKCGNGPCTTHSDAKACNGHGGCYWFPHVGFYSRVGKCSSCAGVDCGAHFNPRCESWVTHRAPRCVDCRYYDLVDKGKGYCNGDCKWYADNPRGGYCVAK